MPFERAELGTSSFATVLLLGFFARHLPFALFVLQALLFGSNIAFFLIDLELHA